MLGTSMSAVAIAFAVLASGGTATSLGVVFAANIAPMVAFMLGGGVLADRLGRRPVMLTADVARCAAQGALAGALFVGRPHVWLFVVAAFVVGTGNAFFSPALSGLPVQLAPRDQLGNANALFGMVQPAAQVAGPALAGVVIAAGSPAAAIAVDAGSYAVSAIALALLSFPDAARAKAARSLLRDLSDGWAEFSAHAWLWLQTVQFTLFNLLTWGPYLVLGPVMARDYLGGARAWGAILACYGGGAIIGGLLALGRRPGRPLLVSTLTTLGFPLPPLALALHLPGGGGGRRRAARGRGLRLRRRDRDDRDPAAIARRHAVPRRFVQHGRRVRARPRRVHRGRPRSGCLRRQNRARLRRRLGRLRHPGGSGGTRHPRPDLARQPCPVLARTRAQNESASGAARLK